MTSLPLSAAADEDEELSFDVDPQPAAITVRDAARATESIFCQIFFIIIPSHISQRSYVHTCMHVCKCKRVRPVAFYVSILKAVQKRVKRP